MLSRTILYCTTFAAHWPLGKIAKVIHDLIGVYRDSRFDSTLYFVIGSSFSLDFDFAHSFGAILYAVYIVT